MKILHFTFLFIPLLISSQLNAEDQKLSKKVYDSIIQPVFEAKCLECHGAKKNKGKLRLHTKLDFLKGGSGAGEDIVISGDAESSELIFRITLPNEDDEAMPPLEDKEHYNPVTEEELAVMQAWINLGASFDLLVSDLDQLTKKAALHVFENMPKKIISKTIALQPKLPDVSPANPNDLEALHKLGVLAMPIAQNTNAIYVNASYLGKNFNDNHLKKLLPLSNQLLWLNLARTGITDEGLKIVSNFKLLQRLHLENTSITSKATIHISKLSQLEYLNLYGTEVSDESVANLKDLSSIKKLFLWKTNFTQQGADSLKKYFVEKNEYKSLLMQKEDIQKKIEKIVSERKKNIAELERKVTKENANTLDINPINQKCPVSNKSVNESANSTFEGRKIGFCCIKCKNKFDNDGAVYRSKIESFSASKRFTEINVLLLNAKTEMEKIIEEQQLELNSVSGKLNNMGPKINLGWQDTKITSK